MAQATRTRHRAHFDQEGGNGAALSHLAARNDAPLARVEEPRFDIFSDVVPWFFIGAAIYSGAALLAVVITGAWLGYRMMQRRGVRLQEIDPREWRMVAAASDLADRVWNGPRSAPRPAQPATEDEPATTRVQAAPAATMTQQQGPVRKTQTKERGLTPDQFAADPLFRAVDDVPHRFVIGHSQGGKSTVLHGMARAWAARGEPVIVCDPDAARGQWPGCEVAGYAEDYRGIAQTLDRVRTIFDERSQLYAEGQRDFAPLHLVLDEVHETFAEVPEAREFVLGTLGRRGAKRGIKVTMGTQDNHKNSLGLDDAGVLDNFITAEIEVDDRGRRVATVYRGNASRKKHTRQYLVPPLPAAKSFIQTKEAPAPLTAPARRPVAADAPRQAVVTERVPAKRPAADLDFLLDDLLAQPVSEPERKPGLDERIAAALGAHGLTAQGVVRVEGGGPTYVINAAKAEATAPAVEKPTAAEKITKAARRRPREGAINVRARQRKLERKAYYEQAAWKGLSLQAAYDARPKGEKGDYNEAANWYREAKRTMKAS